MSRNLQKTNRALLIAGNMLIIAFVLLTLFGKLFRIKYVLISIFLSLMIFISLSIDWTIARDRFFYFTGFGTSMNEEIHGRKYEYEHLIKPNAFVETK